MQGKDMNNESLAFLLLAIYLLLDGILRLVGGTAMGVVLGLLAIAAGILFLLRYVPRGRRKR